MKRKAHSQQKHNRIDSSSKHGCYGLNSIVLILKQNLHYILITAGGGLFAEYNTRQRASVESLSGKGCFAECQILGTRQRFDAVGRRPTPSNFFKTLCRVPQLRYSAKKSVFKPLCRVPRHRHSAKGVFLYFFKFSLPSAMVIALGKATSKFLFFCFLLFHLNNNAHIYNRNHNSTAINYKPYLYITNDQICPKFIIYYKSQVHSPQVHKFDT